MTKQSLTTAEPDDSLIERLSSEASPSGLPAWTGKWRKEGLDRFRKTGLPTTKDEEWKYTNLAPVRQNRYQLAAGPMPAGREMLPDSVDAKETTLVFHNGIFCQDISHLNNIPNGIRIIPLAEALADESLSLQTLLKKSDSAGSTAFTSLNQALTGPGTLITIQPGTVVPELIHIVHLTSPTQAPLVSPVHVIIQGGENSEATIMESHLAVGTNVPYLAVPVTDIHLEQNATLHYFQAQNQGPAAFHMGAVRVWQERDSHYNGFTVTVGGQITRNDLDIVLNGEGAHCTLNGLYCLAGRQLADNHTNVEHRFPNGTSNQLYKGILTDESHGVFNGKIFVRPVAQQTNSYQLNKNLLLGKKCKVDTKPQLEIFADDVKCTHGATIGQLNEDEIFYLQSRCVPRKAAVRMLARGFADDTLAAIGNPQVTAKLNLLLEPTFTAME